MSNRAIELISEHGKDLSFVDIGGLWGTLNEKVTHALEYGVASATLMDIQPLDSDDWAKFHAHAAKRGYEGRYSAVQANLDDRDLIEKHGTFDFVHCSGIIYHAPSPFHTLMQLRAITKKYLILGSMTVASKISTPSGEVDMTDGAAYFIPALSGKKFEIFREYFTTLGLEVHNISSPEQHPWMFDKSAPNYGPWWWLWTAETLAKMAETAGFRVIEIYEAWDKRANGIFMESV